MMACRGILGMVPHGADNHRVIRNRILLACLLSVLLWYPACSWGQSSSGRQGHDYVIGPGDVIEIQVWREPNLSKTIPVRPDGKITLPLLNDVKAAGLTPLELKRRIEKGLSRFVENPTVSVAVNEINSRNVYVMGKVNTPGQYPLRAGLTVLQALSLAGGFAEWADEGHIIILRKENGKQIRIKFNYKKVSKGKDLEQNILLKPGDTIIVP